MNLSLARVRVVATITACQVSRRRLGVADALAQLLL